MWLPGNIRAATWKRKILYMKILSKLERKVGRYSVKNLTAYMIAAMVIGYVMSYLAPQVLFNLMLIPSLVMRGQVWRLVTWVLTPQGGQPLVFIIMLFFYYSIGNLLESTIGTFLYNVYIFGGILVTTIGTMLVYIFCNYVLNVPNAGNADCIVSTYYILLSIFLAVAVCYPDMTVLYAFIIPLKMKWLSVLYLIFVAYSFAGESFYGRVNIVLSLLNFVVFYLSTKNFRRFSPKQMKRKRDYTKQVKVKNAENVGHKCAVCGITDKDAPDMQFRYCSKCKGNREYCQNHLFTHTHIQ